jgi:hypothetical protein
MKANISNKDLTEASSQTQFLSLLLRAKRITLDGVEEEYSSTPFQLGNECVLPEERRDEARKAVDALKQLNSSDPVRTGRPIPSTHDTNYCLLDCVAHTRLLFVRLGRTSRMSQLYSEVRDIRLAPDARREEWRSVVRKHGI